MDTNSIDRSDPRRVDSSSYKRELEAVLRQIAAHRRELLFTGGLRKADRRLYTRTEQRLQMIGVTD